jgi:hypothetical protein
MATLKILFQGVCTHFYDGVVPGVPHRVVLPDASPFRFGMLSVQAQTPVFYFLMPHFAFLRTWPPVQPRLAVDGVMEHGNIFNGAHLRVRNAVGDGIAYMNFFDEVPSITQYVSGYEWSHDVVVGGNAICYLDLYNGVVQKLTEENGACSVVATILTEGLPELEVKPLAGGAPRTIPLDVDDTGVAYLLLGNNGIDCERQEPEQQFDFLLHYLTAKTGLPTALLEPTPGMGNTPQSFTQERLQQSLPSLARLRFPERYEGRCFGELTVGEFAAVETAAHAASRLPSTDYDTSPACSDTRYP